MFYIILFYVILYDYILCFFFSFSGFEKCLDLLCKHYGSEIVKLKDVRNRTPLHVASLRGHTECAKYLLKQGAEINCQDDEGRTPLLSAASNGQTQVIGEVDFTHFNLV